MSSIEDGVGGAFDLEISADIKDAKSMIAVGMEQVDLGKDVKQRPNISEIIRGSRIPRHVLLYDA